MPPISLTPLRKKMIELYGAAAIQSLEAAPRPDGREALPLSPDRVAIATVPPAAPAHSAEPGPGDLSPDTLTVVIDEAEAARFAAEIERDAALGSHADWPDL